MPDRIAVGNTEIVAVLDMVPPPRDPADFFPDVPRGDWAPYEQDVLENGQVQLYYGCFFIRSSGRTVMVDTGMGPGPHPERGNRTGDLLNQIRRLGAAAEDVDVVVHTHLHQDHVGWNLKPSDGAAQPYFPNARYLVPRLDWEHFARPENLEASPHVRDKVVPLDGLGIMELVDDGHHVTDEVTTLLTPGHTPGHQAVLVSSRGERAMIVGDVLHSKAQVRSRAGAPGSTSSNARAGVAAQRCWTGRRGSGTSLQPAISTRTITWAGSSDCRDGVTGGPCERRSLMKIGFIGLGHMGGHMARNLARGGHELTVFDIRKDAADALLPAGASYADGPGEVAASSRLVFTSLPGPLEVEEVALGKDGIVPAARPGTALFDLSTVDPDTIRRIAGAARGRGVTVLDAPVSGGDVGAERGALSVMVGGDRSAYERYRPLLELIGDRVTYCGEVGSGSVCKLVNNVISLGLRVMLPEAFTLGVKAGVDPNTLFEVVSNSSGSTRTMKEYPRTLFNGNFEPGFRVDLAAKDLGLATDEGARLGVPMELTEFVLRRYVEAEGRGWGELASTAVARIQEELAGVEVRA